MKKLMIIMILATSLMSDIKNKIDKSLDAQCEYELEMYGSENNLEARSYLMGMVRGQMIILYENKVAFNMQKSIEEIATNACQGTFTHQKKYPGVDFTNILGVYIYYTLIDEKY